MPRRLIPALLLCACASGANLPPPQQETYPEPQASEDWDGWGEDRPDEPPTGYATLIGSRIGADALRRRLAGQVLEGCYPDGQTFAERLAADGKFYEASGTGNGQQLGVWGFQEDMLCFQYEGQEASCFVATVADGQLHFYTPDLRRYVASTRCPFEEGA